MTTLGGSQLVPKSTRLNSSGLELVSGLGLGQGLNKD